MIRWGALVVAAALLGIVVVVAGPSPFGRVALSIGLPSLASRVFQQPDWRGVALYRSGEYGAAADVWSKSGPESLYNLGNARAFNGEYAASLEAYDLAMTLRSDPMAQANFDLVRGFYAGTMIDPDALILAEDRDGPTAPAPIARGSARGSGSGDAVTNQAATLALAELTGLERKGVRQVFDDRFIAANDRWLATLEDVPGAFLAARIAQEYKRRKKEGIGQPQQEADW